MNAMQMLTYPILQSFKGAIKVRFKKKVAENRKIYRDRK